jgi:hypothetical protein
MICLKYVSTANQEADLFTKPLAAPRFKELRCKLGLLAEDDEIAIYAPKALQR